MPDSSPADRREKERDHDLLTRIDANLSNFMARMDAHVQDDKDNFEKSDLIVAKIEARTTRLERFMWLATGMILLVETFFRWFK